MTRRIRVEDDTYAALAALKDDDETFDELLSRLVDDRRVAVREGAGLWAGSDAADHARAARKEAKRDEDR